MAELPTLISNWLYNVVQPQYTYKQLTYTHLYQLLQVHFGKNLRLKIRTSVYTSHSSGKLTLLLNIFGSIPTVSTSQMNVPVQIWIPLNYPYGTEVGGESDNSGVPLVYIVPEANNDLKIKPGNHVDSLGRFYHPFLSDWYRECKPQSTNGRKFNILELVKILQFVFDRDCPVVNPQANISTNTQDHPTVPPQYHLVQPSQSSMANLRVSPQITGPPLPVKPPKVLPGSTREVPLKYQSPLPLPTPIERVITPHTTGQYQQGISQGNPVINESMSTINYQPQIPHQRYQLPPNPQVQQSYLKPPPQSQPYQNVIPKTHTQPLNKTKTLKNEEPQKDVIDLIDEDRESIPISIPPELTACIQEKIKTTLANEESSIALANTNKLKIEALYLQLSHHHQQAVANSENLMGHIKYLLQQNSNVTKLNQELSTLEEVNTSEGENIHVSSQTKVALDSLITPDLALVNQLYEVVADIKATKDTIDLIGGNFRTEGELIKDSNMDSAVRTVRSLAREAFWLELMKIEIASVMNLS